MNDVVKQTSVPNNNKNPHKSNSKKRKPKEIGQELEEDPRVKVFRKEWFEGKDCLDIGCNSGLITINIAKKFSCRSILGVDIDTDRIEEAYWNLRRIVRESTSKPPAKASRLKDAKAVEVSDHCVTESPTEQKGKAGEGLSPCNLSERVSFRRENFVQSRISDDKRYHTIMCLSVTKWIHLNWGDEGLINLFTKIWKLLQPTAKNNYNTIEIFPESFQDILLDKIGFRLVEDISCNLSGSKSGFQRPILAFWK
uniref:RNA methyltransferase n=1 Tax=Daucus carota subsp. sativus TaxID=79200 RepID=A0A175YJZ7_DAUCS